MGKVSYAEFMGFLDTNIDKPTNYIVVYHIYIYPPTPADARGSAPGNKTFDLGFGLLPLLLFNSIG
jgi:hypothetical protein